MAGTEDDEDVTRLRAEFPGWEIGVRWIDAGSGPGAQVLIAWRGRTTLSAITAAGLARAIAKAGG